LSNPAPDRDGGTDQRQPGTGIPPPLSEALKGERAALLSAHIPALQRLIGNAATSALVQRQRYIPFVSAPQELRPEDAPNDTAALDQATVGELITLYLAGFRLYRVPSTGAVYSREWIVGDDGTALLVGYLRARFAGATGDPADEQRLLAVADETRGSAERRDRVRQFIGEAFARARTDARGGVAVTEVGEQGRTMRPRGAEYPGRIHAAMDIPAAEGSAAYVPVDGMVVFAGRKRGYGNVVIVFHERPPGTSVAGEGPVATTYCHLHTILVRQGQTIAAGQTVGTVGRTGAGEGAVRAGMGSHLHLSVLRVPPGADGDAVARRYSSGYEEANAVNPALWLGQLGTGVSPGVAPTWQGEPVQPALTHPQRQVAAPVVQRRPDDDPAQLAASGIEELFRLYLSEDETITIAPSDETYTRAWIRGDRGAAQIRDVIRAKLTGEAERPERRDPLLAEIARLGGPEERQADLRSAVGATFDTGTRLGEELVTGGDRRLTALGFLERLPSPARRTNTTDRPQFIRPGSEMVAIEGATVHPAVVGPLTTLMAALRAEGARLNDESACRARVGSGWRASELSEGRRYLAALRKTIRLGEDMRGNPYEYPEFPASLEDMARSELGATGSPAHRAFVAALAAEPGWTAASASMLVRTTGRFKAPRGGSTHHSGVVVDINWPVRVGNAVVDHGMDRQRNAAALRTVAGRWLYEHAPGLGFDSYDTAAEIWHMEWRGWPGTAADPDQAAEEP